MITYYQEEPGTLFALSYCNIHGLWEKPPGNKLFLKSFNHWKAGGGRLVWISGIATLASMFMILPREMIQQESPRELLLKICPKTGFARFVVWEKMILPAFKSFDALKTGQRGPTLMSWSRAW